MSMQPLGARQQRGSCGTLPRRSASSDAGSRPRSCRCTPRRPRRGDRTCTPSSFISSSLSIGSLPRASARLTTTRSTPRARDDRRDVLDRADDAGIDDRRADRGRIRIDEADDLDAELLPPLEQLPRQRDRGRRWCRRAAAARAGRPCRVSHSNASRQPDDEQQRPGTTATRNTPRPMIRAGKPEVDRAPGRTRPTPSACTMRTNSSRRSLDDPQVVQVGVVQAQLADERDQQRLLQSALPASADHARVEAEPQRRAPSDDGQR